MKEGKGGINWYRYQEKVVKPLLIPFAKECIVERPDTVVQEDNATPHSKHRQELYDEYRVKKMEWPANSPDLNAIEPC